MSDGRLNWKEGAGLVLAVGSYFIESTPLAGATLLLAAIIGICGLFKHYSFRPAFKVLLSIFILEISCGLFFVVHHLKIEKLLNQLYGTMVAGGDDRPKTHCEVPTNAVALFYGSNVMSSTIDGLFTLISVKGRNLVVLEKVAHSFFIGSFTTLSVKLLDVFDDAGDNIVHIQGDNYWIRPLSRMDRKKLNELTVFDHRGDEVLYIQYVNSTTIKLRGMFRDRGGTPAAIINDETFVVPPSTVVRGGCASNLSAFLVIN